MLSVILSNGSVYLLVYIIAVYFKYSFNYTFEFYIVKQNLLLEDTFKSCYFLKDRSFWLPSEKPLSCPLQVLIYRINVLYIVMFKYSEFSFYVICSLVIKSNNFYVRQTFVWILKCFILLRGGVIIFIFFIRLIAHFQHFHIF